MGDEAPSRRPSSAELHPVRAAFLLGLRADGQYLPEGSLRLSLVPWSLRLLLRRCLWIAWLWCPGGVHSWVPKDCNNMRVLGRLPPVGHSTDSGLKQTPVLLGKRPVRLSWSFGLGGKLCVWHRGLQSCSQGR